MTQVSGLTPFIPFTPSAFDPASLVPPPQKISVSQELSHVRFLPSACSFVAHDSPQGVEDYFREKLKERGIKLLYENQSSKLQIVCQIDPKERDQSYRMVVGPRKIEITAHDEKALFYGINTLLQILDSCPKGEEGIVLPQMEIEDWPDIANRGVLLDISRDRVPTLETLMELVDKLASWKINQLQLYMEHTFAYQGHEKVWKGASPLTKEDVQKLDAYCQSRFIELVPCQNSLAHMHRWIKHQDYRQYAECPSRIDKKEIEKENYQHEGNPGYSLCPTNPATLKLINGLYDQLMPCFSSHAINVGLDEPNDLVQGGECSESELLKEGSAKVYLNYLQGIYQLVKDHGVDRVMQFWADVAIVNRGILDQLPSDAIALLWGYEKDFPFELGKRFAEKKIQWYACPSTCSWSSLAGRTEDAIYNLTNAANRAKEHHASGYLITDWGDNGHHQPLSVSYLGFLLGASLSWKVRTQKEVEKIDLPHLLDLHVFHDLAGEMGKIAYQVGNLYKLAIKDPQDLTQCSALFRLLVFNDAYPDEKVVNALSGEGLKKTKELIKDLKLKLAHEKMQGTEKAKIHQEYDLILALLDFSCTFGLTLLKHGQVKEVSQLPKSEKKALKSELKELLARYQEVWLLRDRKGGLEDSVRRLKHLYSLFT